VSNNLHLVELLCSFEGLAELNVPTITFECSLPTSGINELILGLITKDSAELLTNLNSIQLVVSENFEVVDLCSHDVLVVELVKLGASL
jgi:hypothetical protein